MENVKTKVEEKIRELCPELRSRCQGNGIHDTSGLHSFREGGSWRNECYYCGKERKDVHYTIHLEHVLSVIFRELAQDHIIVLSKHDMTWSNVVIDLLLEYDVSKPFIEQSSELYTFLSKILDINN